MRKIIAVSVLSTLVFTAAKTQTNETGKNVFIRVYDSNYSKMGKGNLLYSPDSAIMVIHSGKVDTFSVKQVYYIKTKRSAGHSVLKGTGIGTGVGLTVITFGVFVVSGHSPMNAYTPDDHHVQHTVAFLSPLVGAAIGALVGATRKNETFEISSDIEKWKPVKTKLLNIQSYSWAQKTSIGITAGTTLASYKITGEDFFRTTNLKTGFNAGLVLSTPLSTNISFRPELKYVQKGGKVNIGDGSDKLILNYIELPLNFVFNTNTSEGMFFAGFGPSVNVGISGKHKWDYTNDNVGEEKVKFGNDGDFKPFEFGINVLAGYQLAGGFFVSANYNAGLNNIQINDPDIEGEFYNRYCGINVGFMF